MYGGLKGGGGRKQKDDGGGRFCSLLKHSQVHSHELTASGDGAIEQRGALPTAGKRHDAFDASGSANKRGSRESWNDDVVL